MQLKPQFYAGFHLVTIQRDARAVHDHRAGLMTVRPRPVTCQVRVTGNIVLSVLCPDVWDDNDANQSALDKAIRQVQHYLSLMEQRDLAGARALLAPEFRMPSLAGMSSRRLNSW